MQEYLTDSVVFINPQHTPSGLLAQILNDGKIFYIVNGHKFVQNPITGIFACEILPDTLLLTHPIARDSNTNGLNVPMFCTYVGDINQEGLPHG